MKRSIAAIGLALALGGVGVAQDLPDVAVSGIGSFNDWRYWGQAGGIAAYSFATTSCNVGNVQIDWMPSFNMPVIAQNIFRIKDGHIEQLGYSFLKDSFCAVSEPSCGSCQPTPCSTLGVGCADTYGSGLNDGRFGWAKWPIDANNGTWTLIPPGPSGDAGAINGRLQIDIDALGDPSSVYVAESQYVSGHDQQAGLGQNNQSWRYVNLMNMANPSGSGPVHMFDPAIQAWQDVYSDVMVSEANVSDEGGAGIHGFMWVGSKATDLGNGLWRYDYAVQNQTSMCNVGSVTVNSTCDMNYIDDVLSRDVRHHSGSPYSNEPWDFTRTAGQVVWSTEDAGANPNANAIRWGNLHSFSFVTTASPDSGGTVDLGLFDCVGSVSAPAIVPAGPGFEFPAYCVPTNTSLGVPITMSASGSPIIAYNNLFLECFNVPSFNLGYFLMSQTQQVTMSPPGSQGNLCIAGNIVRFSGDVLDSGILGTVFFEPDATDLPGPTVFQPGDTWTFQYWTRDGSNPSNFSPAAAITFCQ